MPPRTCGTSTRSWAFPRSRFAIRIGLPVETVRNWEQGKRDPQGPARAMLRIIDRAPEAELHALTPDAEEHDRKAPALEFRVLATTANQNLSRSAHRCREDVCWVEKPEHATSSRP
jgi:hypothetical protein